MWIRSQNKKELFNCTSFAISKNIGGKKKSAIIGTIQNGIWGNKSIVLGLYDTNQAAFEELTRLQDAIDNVSKVYEMN